MITEDNRREFEDLGVDQLRKRVERSNYDSDKLRQAREWLDENNPAWISARAAQRAGTKATIALWLSGASVLVSIILGLWKGH
jgi:hypothetical protein